MSGYPITSNSVTVCELFLSPGKPSTELLECLFLNAKVNGESLSKLFREKLSDVVSSFTQNIQQYAKTLESGLDKNRQTLPSWLQWVDKNIIQIDALCPTIQNDGVGLLKSIKKIDLELFLSQYDEFIAEGEERRKNPLNRDRYPLGHFFEKNDNLPKPLRDFYNFQAYSDCSSFMRYINFISFRSSCYENPIINMAREFSDCISSANLCEAYQKASDSADVYTDCKDYCRDTQIDIRKPAPLSYGFETRPINMAFRIGMSELNKNVTQEVIRLADSLMRSVVLRAM